jgi:hypothetical protein
LATGIKAWKNRVRNDELAWIAVIVSRESGENDRVGGQLRENCVWV